MSQELTQVDLDESTNAVNLHIDEENPREETQRITIHMGSTTQLSVAAFAPLYARVEFVLL